MNISENLTNFINFPNHLNATFDRIHGWTKSEKVAEKEVLTRVVTLAAAAPLAGISALFYGIKSAFQGIGAFTKYVIISAPSINKGQVAKFADWLPNAQDVAKSAEKTAMFSLSFFASLLIGGFSPVKNLEVQDEIFPPSEDDASDEVAFDVGGSHDAGSSAPVTEETPVDPTEE